MTLAAPRSRQGKLLLVLAFLAATVAIAGTFLWATQGAQANVPAGTTVVVGDTTSGAVAVGSIDTYNIQITPSGPCTTLPASTCANPTFEIQADSNLWPFAWSGTLAWASPICTIPGGNLYNTVRCTQASGSVGAGTLAIQYIYIATVDGAPGDQNGLGAIPGPVFCKVYDDGDTSGGGIPCTYDTNAPVTDSVEDDYVVVPLTAANPVTTPHTIHFTVPPGFTCKSDPTVNDTTRVCGAGDVAIANSGSTAAVTGFACSACGAGTMGSPATVDVTINSANAGTARISLDLVYNAGVTYGLGTQACGPTCIEQVDPVAFKTYGLIGANTLRHVDLPDQGTEDASGGSQNPYCSTYLTANPTTAPVVAQFPAGVSLFNGVCGVLPGQDDIDDAEGSFHGVCIIGSTLTFANDRNFIVWHIDPISGGTPVAGPQSYFPGPNGEPCVKWSVGAPGTQQIYAVYTNPTGGLTTTFLWDDHQPLIKEWNTIDSTRIVSTTGDLGATAGVTTLDRIKGNTLGARDWPNRDCSMIPLTPAGGGDCALPNLDGLTMPIGASPILNSNQGLIKAAGATFIDYTMGSHDKVLSSGAYNGPVDGALQTYTISGDCGSVRLENPSTGAIVRIGNTTVPASGLPTFATVSSSDKGVALEFVTNFTGDLLTTVGNGNCGANATICVTITTSEDQAIHSPPRLATADEKICVTYHIGPPTNKTPILAWAGQRVVLENYWGDPTVPSTASTELKCPVSLDNSRFAQPFGVLYSKQNGPGGFTAQLVHGFGGAITTNDNAIVNVAPAPINTNPGGVTEPNSNCTSRIIFEAEDQGEVDVSAYAVQFGARLDNAHAISQQVAFVIYYMKLESEKLQLIPDKIPATDAWDKGGTPTSDPVTATVSDNVAAQVTVKGWVLTDNCPARPERTGTGLGDGQTGEYFPPNRCIFPDDWAFKAGLSGTAATNPLVALCTGHAAPAPQQCRPEFDIATSTTAYSSLCPASAAFIAGPFSLLDQITHAGKPVTCGDSLAPFPPDNLVATASRNCLTAGLTYSCRESNFPDGTVDAVDAPMPPALIEFDLNGAGFLTGIGKAAAGVDTGFNVAAIPAEPWIAPVNLLGDGEGYVWNTWGVGGNNGLYHYWTDLAAKGLEVISCAGKSAGMFVDPTNPARNPCTNDPAPLLPCRTPGAGAGCIRTGGYAMTEVYTDEHGVAMTLINGDANLAFTDCKTSSAGTTTITPIVFVNGFYCAKGATVGTSTLTAFVDYPDKRKHFAEVTNSVTITWTWNGIKDVTVVPDPNDTTGQFWYVVFHVTDRDGFCGGSDSLHPVLGERVDFSIDSTVSSLVHIAPDANGNSAEGPLVTLSGAPPNAATTHTFDTSLYSSVATTPFNAADITVATGAATGECQAWIHISESLHQQVNVVVAAFDPEGTVTFDTKAINTPTPTPAPTPAPTPFTLHLKWGDSDCDGNVAPRDGQAILLHFLDKAELSQSQPCPSMGEKVMIAGNVQRWGDFDCNGAVAPRDGQAVLYNFLSKTALTQTSPCPAIGSAVDVQPIVP